MKQDGKSLGLGVFLEACFQSETPRAFLLLISEFGESFQFAMLSQRFSALKEKLGALLKALPPGMPGHDVREAGLGCLALLVV